MCWFFAISAMRTAERAKIPPNESRYQLTKTYDKETKPLTGIAAPLGGVLISHHPAVMDLILLGLPAALCVTTANQIGQQSRGGPTGQAQFEGGGAGGDASVEVVDP